VRTMVRLLGEWRHQSTSSVLTENAKIDVRIPRDWEGTFDPKLIQRYQRRFPGFDQDCFDVRARHERAGDPELYGIDVSPDLISTVPTQFL
jgi:putative transposase